MSMCMYHAERKIRNESFPEAAQVVPSTNFFTYRNNSMSNYSAECRSVMKSPCEERILMPNFVPKCDMKYRQILHFVDGLLI